MSHDRVLLLGSSAPDDRKTYSVLQSLARSGFSVSVASHAFNNGTLQSNRISERLPLPKPSQGLKTNSQAIRTLMKAGKFGACLPCNDFNTLALAEAQQSPESQLACAIPPLESLHLCKDKKKTTELASRLGIEVPQSFEIRDEADLQRLSARLRYPSIIKPRISAGAIGLSVVNDPHELIQAWHGMPAINSPVFDFDRPIVQQKIDGEVHEVCGLFCHGEPRAMLTQRRLLMYPPGAGAGIYNETTHIPALMKRAEALFKALSWHGPAQAEFIVEHHSGRPYLLEINGRFWGTLALSVAAGMDFPLLTYRLATEGDIPRQTEYAKGVCYRWPFPYGMMHAIETGQWLGFFRDFILPRPRHHSDLDLRDPVPLMYELRAAWNRFSSRGFQTSRQSGNGYEWLKADQQSGQEGGSDES